MNRTITALFLGFLISQLPAKADADAVAPGIMGLFRAGTNGIMGSGAFIRYDTNSHKLHLLTAAHVAEKLGPEFVIIMTTDRPEGYTTRVRKAQWRFCSFADIAVSELDPETGKNIAGRAIPLKQFNPRSYPPFREATITMLGYPRGLGTSGNVSPLSIETKLASGLLTVNASSFSAPATYLFTQAPSIQGMSGGPVFDFGGAVTRGGETSFEFKHEFIGIIHGTLPDETGGKLGLLVPATEIYRFLKELNIPTPDIEMRK